MLAAAKVAEGRCDDGNASVCLCDTVNCGEIMVRQRRQSDNGTLCFKSPSKSQNKKQTEKLREENYHKQIAYNSKTPLTYLTEEQRSEHLKRLKEENYFLKKKNEHLKRETTQLKIGHLFGSTYLDQVVDDMTTPKSEPCCEENI